MRALPLVLAYAATAYYLYFVLSGVVPTGAQRELTEAEAKMRVAATNLVTTIIDLVARAAALVGVATAFIVRYAKLVL